MARDELNTVCIAKGEKLHQSPRFKTSGAFSISSLKHEAAVSPGKVSGRHLRWMQEAGMWDGRRNTRTRLPLSGNTPSSPFNSFHSPASCSASALLHASPAPSKLGITVNPLVKGQSSSVRTFLQGPMGKRRGRQEASLGRSLRSDTSSHGHPRQSNHPRPPLTKCRGDFFQWTQDARFRRFRRTVCMQGRVSLCAREMQPHC